MSKNIELIFATGNENKVREIRNQLPPHFQVKTLKEIGITEELPEEQDTIEGNSLQKTEALYAMKQIDCFGEDTGLEVEALDGAPGVYSARYAGPEKDNVANMNLLLKNLEGKSIRKAQFKTVITLIINGKVHQFEGVLKGEIGQEMIGTKGFGYDPVFMIEDGRTLAQLTIDEKAAISHRGKAVRKLIKFLEKAYI